MQIKKHRSIFISDIHIGIRASKVKELLHFLKYNDCDHLYLLGDIIDGWRLKKNWFWNQDFNTFIQKVLKKARSGTKVYYIPGNHDEIIREFIPINFGDIQIVRDASYTSLNGKKHLVFHGDDFDFIVRKYKWIAIVGSFLYEFLLKLSPPAGISQPSISISHPAVSISHPSISISHPSVVSVIHQ